MSYVTDIGISWMLRTLTKFYKRPLFQKFLILEDIKDKIFQAVKRKEKTVPDLLISYVSTAFLIPAFILERVRWEVLISLFLLAASVSVPKKDIPLLRPSAAKHKKEVWDYEGRGSTMYIHIIARMYGWDIKTIQRLDVDVALALVQEILVDEQLDREFLWSMSDKSYIYNYKTKSGKPNPLDRPYFMLEKVEAPKMTKMPKSMLPAGVDYGTIPEAYRPKEIEH